MTRRKDQGAEKSAPSVFYMKEEPRPNSDEFRRRRAPKRRGEAAEAAFLSKAADLGFDVAKPWGDSAQFDFILHTGSHCWRVQVKSTRCFLNGRYSVMLRCPGRVYTKDDVDFVVVYIVPVNAWYVFPIEVVCGKRGIHFSPRPGSRSWSEAYREAWCLMACPRDGACNPEISVNRRCLASGGQCPFASVNLARARIKRRRKD